eukprot:521880-Rhodomonas_salina.1
MPPPPVYTPPPPSQFLQPGQYPGYPPPPAPRHGIAPTLPGSALQAGGVSARLGPPFNPPAPAPRPGAPNPGQGRPHPGMPNIQCYVIQE